MSEESVEVKWEGLIKKHSLKESELPEKIRTKIDQFNREFDLYDKMEEDDETALRDAEMRLESYDTGICADLESHIAEIEKKKQEEAAAAAAAAPPAGTPPAGSPPPSDTPEGGRGIAWWLNR